MSYTGLGAVGEQPKSWFSIWDSSTGSWQLISWYRTWGGYPEMLGVELFQCAAAILPGGRSPYMIAEHPSMKPVGGVMSWSLSGLGSYENFDWFAVWMTDYVGSWSFVGWLFSGRPAMRKLAAHLIDCATKFGRRSNYIIADYPWGRPVDDRMTWKW